MSFTPKVEYLQRVDRGEIIMKLVRSASGYGEVLEAVGGTYQLRLYEEADLVTKVVTAKRAGWGSAFRDGVPAKLTEAGRSMLSDCD